MADASNPYAVERRDGVLDQLSRYLLDIHLRLVRSEARDGIIDQGARAIADRGTKYIEATVLPIVSEVAEALADFRGGVSAERVVETEGLRFLTPALLATLAALDSPEFSGQPTAPTAPEGDASDLLATTGFVDRGLDALAAALAPQLAALAPKVSPQLTGTPVAPTAAAGTDTGQLATTAFVQAVAAALRAGAPADLDTLDKLAAAIGDDPAYSATIAAAIGRRLRFDQLVTLTATEQSNARQNINAQTALGFTPVQQNGGADMSTSKLYMGWSQTLSRLKAQVDSVDIGYIWTERDTTVSTAANGYLKLPSGIILQWGQLAAGASDTSITFPTAFPTACLCAVATPVGAPANTTLQAALTDTITRLSFTLRRRQADNGGSVSLPASGPLVRWFAVGH